jgi:transposase-like protein
MKAKGTPGCFPRRLPTDCQVVAVGKRRDGGTRYWCRRHGADATAKYGKPANKCRAAHILPIRPNETLKLDLDRYAGGVALWGAVPAIYDTTRLPMDRGIHVHARATARAKKEMDVTFRAVRIVGGRLPKDGFLVSELDAIYYMASEIFGLQMKYVTCSHCACPHLDRDWFSVHPHRRHLCSGCGKHFQDTETAVGNPIWGVRDECGAKKQESRLAEKKLRLRQIDFPGGIQVWGSNPAFLWTSDRAEEEGIHVHAFRNSNNEPELDETYGEVTIDGVALDPSMVRVLMAQSALPSLNNRVLPIGCPSCHESLFCTGELAFTPRLRHTCGRCGHQFSVPGKLRKTVGNPLPAILARLAEKAPRKPQHHDLGLMPETL